MALEPSRLRRMVSGVMASQVVAASVLLAASSAAAQSVNEIQVGGDTVTGSIGGDGEVDRIPFRLVDGSAYSLQLQAAKKSPLLPDLTVLGVDRLPDGVASAAIVVAKKGSKVVLKNLPVVGTGLRYLEVRGADGTSGDWILKTKVKHPKGVFLAGSAPGGAPVSLPFHCPGNATATMVVKAVKGSAVLPVLDSVLDPNGAPMIVDDVVATSTGFTVKNLLLGKPGQYTLEVGSASAGDFTVKTKWKVPKPVKRELLDSQIVTLPVLHSIDPAEGYSSQAVAVTLEADFALPGARVVFRQPPAVISVAPNLVTVTGRSAEFLVSLAAFPGGTYDVELTNPDGGSDTLPQAFFVETAPPVATGVDPTFGYDSRVTRVSILGSHLRSGLSVRLRRGPETIQGTNLFTIPTRITADFDLEDRAHGLWDMVIEVPGSEFQTLPSSFEIQDSPPFPASVSPWRNPADPVVAAAIAGAGFNATPTVALRREGLPDIPGTGVSLSSSREIRATFDATGAWGGERELVVVNPDGREGTVPDAFLVSGPLGPPGKVATAGYRAYAPPSVVYNPERNEFAVAWVEVDEYGTAWDLFVQRLDATGAPLADRVAVSDSAPSVPKKDAVVAWDSDNDEYLVAWAEIRSVTPIGSPPPPAGSHTQNLYEILVQLFADADLRPWKSNTQVTDKTKPYGYYLDEFNNTRPDAVWDPRAARWKIAWMQEWDTSGNVSYDDYDTLVRGFDRYGNLWAVTGIGGTAYHEGDPSLCWDPLQEKVIVLLSARRSSDSDPLDLQIGQAYPYRVVVKGINDDLVDARAVFDRDKELVLVTWTRLTSSGKRSVEAVLVDPDKPDPVGAPTLVGSPTAVGSGAGDHFHARPLYNPYTKEAMIAWTRVDAAGKASVRLRRVDTSGSGGLALVGSETEISVENGDEAAPAVATNTKSGEAVVLWMSGMDLVTEGAYKGSVIPGTYRGREIWMQRLK